ncbi:MAG TPA: hypothetical protein VJ827_09595 [Rubrobacter sp.]|nr:hypothetical protein [Rubrobacter sp.]
MRERLEQRLAELRTEFESGQQTLDQLETQATTVRQTLLRISGAIQVLEEELGEPHGNSSEDTTVTGSATASRQS